MVSRATAPIEGNASPRKPKVRMSSRSSLGNFEVAWRSTANARSSRVMPAPSSLTRINRRPPPSVTISMRVAPASSAFSTSSLTTLAGRSTTSPAAMRLTMPSESWRTGMGATLKERVGSREWGEESKRFLIPYSLLPPVRLLAPQALDAGAVLLGSQAPLLGAAAWLGGPAWRRRDTGAADELDQALARVGAVALLGAMALRHDDENALAREPLARQPLQAHAYVGR